MTSHIYYSNRDADFLKACRTVIAQNPDRHFSSLLSLSLAVLRSQAPSFYTEPDYAYRVILSIRRDGPPKDTGVTCRKWIEFYNRVNSRMRCNPHESLRDAVDYVAAFESASSFFISPECAVKILRRDLRLRSSTLAAMLPCDIVRPKRSQRSRHYSRPIR